MRLFNSLLSRTSACRQHARHFSSTGATSSSSNMAKQKTVETAKSWFGAASNYMKTRPVQSNMLTMWAVLALGDFGCQGLERYLYRDDPMATKCTDWRRVARVSVYGFILGGPLLAGWFRVVERIVPKTLTGGAAVAARIAATQVIMSPIYNGIFFGWVQAFDVYDSSAENYSDKQPRFGTEEASLSAHRWFVKCRVDLIMTCAIATAFWAPLHYVTFSFVPLQWRVVSSSIGSVLWSAYLTLTGHKHPPHVQKQKQDELQEVSAASVLGSASAAA